MASSNGGVPPGFRFHPTDEELLHYYLKKKVSFEKFDLEVIREVDLNKMEPWDLQERCRIGSTPQNEWYFFSHKDRKYPTGSRTNRATNAGFWKATGRDKCIRNTFKKIGMRKTLVFYRGRAPHGQKTDWIMHEYRLEDIDDSQSNVNEDGWVVCRVFKKKNLFKVDGGSSSNNNNNIGGADHQHHLLMNSNNNQHRSLMMSSLRDNNNNIHQYLRRHSPNTDQQLQTTAFDLYKPPDLALHYSHLSTPTDHHQHYLQPPPQQTDHDHLLQMQPMGSTYHDYNSTNPTMLKQLLSNQRDCESGSDGLAGAGQVHDYPQQAGGSANEMGLELVGTTSSCEVPAVATQQMMGGGSGGGGGGRVDDNEQQGLNDWAMLDRLVMTNNNTTSTTNNNLHQLGVGINGGHHQEESSSSKGVVSFGENEQHQQPNASSSSVQQINQLSLRGEMMDFWGYGK